MIPNSSFERIADGFALTAGDGAGLRESEWQTRILEMIPDNVNKVLLLPPDYTRFHSMAGTITSFLYEVLHDKCEVDVMPALGTHVPMTRRECEEMLPGIPFERILIHSWREDVVRLGEVPADFITEISEGLMNEPVPVEVNRRLLDPSYDLIVSIGQVVPHEVVGMANRNKNICVGCGGAGMINGSHMLGAFYGLERIMGRTDTPVRRVFDWAEDRYFSHIPLTYLLTVTTVPEGKPILHGLFAGRDRALFRRAADLAREKNMDLLDEPIKTAVVSLPEAEFKTTWLGNKAIYRTRMAMADGGCLYILAPGVARFGEDDTIDGLLRKYGYPGRQRTLELIKTHPDLASNLSAAAHMIHGSSDGRFRVIYCTKHLSREEVIGAGYGYMPYEEAAARFRPETMRYGFNGDIFYIPNPALGLWALKRDFE